MNETTEKILEPIGQQQEETRVKPYTFRRLNAQDVFPMVSIISKIGLDEFMSIFEKDGIKNLLASASGEEDVSIFGYSVILEIVGKVCGNLPKCEKDIFNLLGSVSGTDAETVRKMDFVDFTEMIVDFIMKEEFRDFMKVVSRFVK